ncbi:Hsp20/alpha crystallin family protein [Patescibacteria group bacterium]|nr:Hsp20/alpha crystallin family protein [Patescibacteria group bacterium]MBU4116098.1 Hsp20/alpha crystallin family protein [Patescibacteria group bacterium]
MKKRGSFFERLTGTININDDIVEKEENDEKDWIEDEKEEYQLTVDVYNKPEEIIIHTMVAGVRPEDLDISITREMVSMRGERKEPEDVATEDYYHKELYWGSFSRTIMLPAEIEVEEAEAIENHGLLSIRLPKIDKERQTKLKVKTRS